MILHVGSRLIVSSPTSTFKNAMVKRLTWDNPEYVKRVRLGKWTKGISKTLQGYSFNGDQMIVPYGTLNYILENFDFDNIISEFHEEHRVNYHAKDMGLRDYQEEAVNHLIEQTGGLLEAPTGSGKTQIALAVIFRLGLKALWITHTTDLMVQSKERALQYIDSSLVGTINDGKLNVGKGITFAVVNSLASSDLLSLEDEWDVIIVDECHRVSGTATSVTMFYKVLSHLAAKYKYGISATLTRKDGMFQCCVDLLGDVSYRVAKEETEDFRAEVSVCPVYIERTPGEVLPDGREEFVELLHALTIDTKRSLRIIEILQERQRPSLILSQTKPYLKILIGMLPEEMRSQAVMIEGSTPQRIRNQALDDMREGKLRYLFATYALAKEGLDIPRLADLFLVTPTTSPTTIPQAVGRVSRRYKDKKAMVFDFVDDSIYTMKAFKKRCTLYRKLGCTIRKSYDEL